jgi:hypothetical protein
VIVSPIKFDTPPFDEHHTEVDPLEHIEFSPVKEVQEPVLDKIYTAGILGNTLTWGDQQILDPMDEVANIHVISYDRNRKAIIRRTTKKGSLTLDSMILITTKENLLITENANTSKLIIAGMAITNATLDREKQN